MKKNIFILLLLLNNSNPNAIAHDTIDYAVKHKIILCTGPSKGRRQQLIDITRQDMELIPFKKIFVITNDPNNENIDFNGQKPTLFYFPERGKQLDCANCIIYSIIQVALDSECLDDDIILFKHESVYINDMNLVAQAIGKIQRGYDMVAKYWVGLDIINGLNFDDYYHTDSFFLSVGAARMLYKNLKEIICFTKDYQFCEEYFTRYIVNKLLKVYKIDYHHSSWKDNELGLYHIPRYEEDPSWYWDKKNYDILYN